MNARSSFLAFSICLALNSWALAQAPTPEPARIEALVRKLGSSSYAQREEARRELQAIGTPALDQVRKLSKSTDAEISRRVAELIRGFEEQLLTKQVLAPKEVHLKLKDASVQQAVAELANISGYPIQLQGDLTKVTNKKITLDTGKISFWQAFDQLCTQAGLMERVDQASLAQGVADTNRVLGGRGGIRRIQQFPPPYPGLTGPIIVTNRNDEKSMVSHAGAVRTELRISRDAAAKELSLLFILSVEPRLQNSAVVGSPVLEKILDERSQKLSVALEHPKANVKTPLHADEMMDMPIPMMSQPGRRVAQIRVKEGPDAARQLNELTGKLALQVDLQNELLARIDNLLSAAGKSATGANGGTMKVNSITKRPSGEVEVQVSIDNMSPNPFGGNIIVNGNGGVIIRGNVVINGGGMVIGPNGVRINGTGNNGDLPDLLDAKGQKFRVANLLNDSFNFVNGSTTRNATIVFAPNPGQVEPRELVLLGTRNYTISVPFRFEKIQIP